MENLKLKAYVIPEQLKKVLENNELVYTVNCYMSSKTWDDGIISQSIFIGMNHEEYIDIMTNRFDCIKFNYKLFFSTKSQCEEAVEFIDSLIILRKLL